MEKSHKSGKSRKTFARFKRYPGENGRFHIAPFSPIWPFEGNCRWFMWEIPALDDHARETYLNVFSWILWYSLRPRSFFSVYLVPSSLSNNKNTVSVCHHLFCFPTGKVNVFQRYAKHDFSPRWTRVFLPLVCPHFPGRRFISNSPSPANVIPICWKYSPPPLFP